MSRTNTTEAKEYEKLSQTTKLKGRFYQKTPFRYFITIVIKIKIQQELKKEKVSLEIEKITMKIEYCIFLQPRSAGNCLVFHNFNMTSVELDY